jgi:hypothetical protein
MKEPHDPNRTVDEGPCVPAGSLDAGLAAAFGKAKGPRSSLDEPQRPVLLKEAEGESAHAEERKAFTLFWADVAALLLKAETPAKKETER